MYTLAVFMDYLPGKKSGGPLKRVVNMVDALGDDFTIYIISRDHDFGENKKFTGIEAGWNTVGKAKVCYLEDKEITSLKYGQIMDEIHPDMVYTMTVFSVNMVFPCINAAKKRNIPILIAPCGQTCANSLRLKRWKKIPYLKLMKIFHKFDGIYFHTTSDEECESMIHYLGIKKEYLCNIPNIPQKQKAVNKKPKEEGKVKILYVSRIHRKKNLLFAIRAAKKVNCDVEFDIYGPLEDKEYWDECLKEMEITPNNARIVYQRALTPEEAETIYQGYDLFFFPTLSENYGFVIAESFLSDCPVLLSGGTTPWDDYSDYADLVFDLNNEDGFVKAIETVAGMNQEQYNALVEKTRQYVRVKMDLYEIIQKHRDLYNKVINKAPLD